MITKPKNQKNGFTLVELLIVIVVVAVLAGISVVSYNQILSRANDAKRIDDVNKIAKAIQVWGYDTGQSFNQMNTGWAGNGGTGWHDSDYGGGSVSTIMIGLGLLTDDIREPAKTGVRGYLITPCTTNTDNRRVVMAQLDKAPSRTIIQQLQGHNCNSSYINTGINSYGANYAILISV